MYLQRGKIVFEKRLITFTKNLEKERRTTKTQKKKKGTKNEAFLL